MEQLIRMEFDVCELVVLGKKDSVTRGQNCRTYSYTWHVIHNSTMVDTIASQHDSRSKLLIICGLSTIGMVFASQLPNLAKFQ